MFNRWMTEEIAAAALDRAWLKARTIAPERLPAARAKIAALGMHAVMDAFRVRGAELEAELARRIKEHFNVEYAA
jgi:hypothetical protein